MYALSNNFICNCIILAALTDRKNSVPISLANHFLLEGDTDSVKETAVLAIIWLRVVHTLYIKQRLNYTDKKHHKLSRPNSIWCWHMKSYEDLFIGTTSCIVITRCCDYKLFGFTIRRIISPKHCDSLKTLENCSVEYLLTKYSSEWVNKGS